MESRKMVLMNLFAGQQWRHSHTEQACGHNGGRREWDKLRELLWRTVQKFLKKLGIKLPYDPAVPLLGIYPEETIIEKDSYIPMFITALFTIARTQKQPRCPSTDKQIKKLWNIYTVEYYSDIKGTFLSQC